jgi:hypothetical protein
MRQADEVLKTMVSAQNNVCAPTSRLSQDAHVRTDAWSRAAQQVRERASFLGLTLDETALARQDVRDLQTTYAALLHGKAGAQGRARHLQGQQASDGTAFDDAYNWLVNCVRRVVPRARTRASTSTPGR